MSRTLVVLGLALLAVAPLACSFSYSSASHSKSVESSSASLGSSSASISSSSPGAAERAYHDDVRDYTVAFVKSSSGDIQGFETDLGRLAARHGITNWEENMTLFRPSTR